MQRENLLAIDPTLLEAEPDVLEAIENCSTLTGDERFAALADVTERFPASSLAWAHLAEAAEASGDRIASYAFARVGYHRGLDALRKAGWRGQGPVPWSHEPNRGVLRAIAALARAAKRIGEEGEPERLVALLNDADPEAAGNLAT